MGAVGLTGWLFGVPAIRQIVPGLPQMQPNTALGLLACGLGRALAVRVVGEALATFAAFVGVATMAEYATGLDLGVDDLFLRGTMRMSPQTSVSLAATGMALLALRRPRTRGLAHGLAVVPLLLSYLSLVGMLFGAKIPVFPLATTMAIHTASGFVAVGTGLLLALPERGVVARVRSPGAGGRTVRALLPVLVLLPPALAAARNAGEVRGAWDRGFGIALECTTMLALLCAALFGHARRLDDSDAARALAAARFRHILENTPEGIGTCDPCGRVIYANPRLAVLIGHPSPVGVGLLDCVVEPVRALFVDFLAAAARVPCRTTVAIRTGSGTLRFLRFSATPLPPDDEAPSTILLVVTDETSRRIAEDRLRAHARALELATRDLDAFAVSASHDLKEPLRKIQLLADRAASAAATEVPDTLARIRKAAATLQARVGDLLAYSRLAASASERTPVDLGAALHDAITRLRERLDAAGARVEADALPTIDGDAGLLREVFFQLLDNALKFRRPDVPLVVRVTSQPRAGGRVEIAVEDNGRGFEAAYGDRIFGLFRTLEAREDHVGTGVGLAVCRRVVELHDGEIEAHGRPGEGARFVVRLPVRATLGAPPACVPSDLS